MKILMVHNYYRRRGGEECSFESERDMLRDQGHDVVTYTRSNEETAGIGKSGLFAKTVWNKEVYRQLRALIQKEKPQVAHFQNTWALVSPAAYYAAEDENVPVVQVLSNYRLFCPSSTGFFRNGKICEDCLGKAIPLPGVVHACYRDSRAETAALTAMICLHRLMGTWRKKVDMYIAVSEFVRRKAIEGGLRGDKIVVRRTIVHPDPGERSTDKGYAVYCGRLDNDKGLFTLLKAWESAGKIPLKIIGDGPLREDIVAFVKKIGREDVECLGYREKAEMFETVKNASFLICPSEWYEAFGRVIIEAFACGVPVIASRIGGLAETVADGWNGLHFVPGDVDDLASKIKWAIANPREMMNMGRNARREFLDNYSGGGYQETPVTAYELVLKHRRARDEDLRSKG